MKLTLELTRDTHGRPTVLATLDGGWPSVEECQARRRAYYNQDTIEDDLNSDEAYCGHDPRTIAGVTAGDLLGHGKYVHPVDELPNADGALVYVGGAVTR